MRTLEPSGGRLAAQLDRPVHLLQATPSLPLQHLPEQRQQETPEPLPLDESHPPLTQRLDDERMLAVEQTGYPQMTQPAEFPTRMGHQHLGAERHPSATGRLDEDLEAG